MSTVKVLDLPYITDLQPNTANTVIVGVDIPSDTTGILTLTTLARRLYSNNNLYVGNGNIIFANAIGEFVGNSNTYLQVVLQNRTSNGSGDFVVTADDGTDSEFYLDLGINGSTYNDPDYSATKAHDGYLYVRGNGTPANLVLGTTHSSSRVNFIVGGTESGNIVGFFDSTGVYSGSINSLVAANVATLRGEITANADSANSVINTRISANVATLRGEITANADSANSVINTRISSNIATANLFTQAAFDKANNAIANTNGVLTAGDFYISGDGIVNGTLKPEKGFIFVPTILAGSQTAFTIDFSTTSLIKANIAADCAITLSNYVPGKVVEVWITNTSGSNRTVTHGCSAQNSTENSTTVTLSATSSAYLRYFSIESDEANTFVAITAA